MHTRSQYSQLKMPGGGCSVTSRQFSSSLLSPQSFCWLQISEPRYKHLPLAQVNLHSVKAFVAWKPASCILLFQRSLRFPSQPVLTGDNCWACCCQVTSILALQSPFLFPFLYLAPSSSHLFPGLLMCRQKGSALNLSRSVGQSHQPASQRICAMMNVKMKQIACQDLLSLLQLSSNPAFIQHHFFRSRPMVMFNCLSSLVFLSPQARSLSRSVLERSLV